MRTLTLLCLSALALGACGNDDGPCGPNAAEGSRPAAPAADVENETAPITVSGSEVYARNLRDWQEDDFSTSPDPEAPLCLGWVQQAGGYDLQFGGMTLFAVSRPMGYRQWRTHVPEGGVTYDEASGYILVNTDNTLGNRAVRVGDRRVFAIDFAPLDTTYAVGGSFAYTTQFLMTGAIYKVSGGETWEIGAATYDTSMSGLRFARASQTIDLPATATPTATFTTKANAGGMTVPVLGIMNEGELQEFEYDPMAVAFVPFIPAE